MEKTRGRVTLLTATEFHSNGSVVPLKLSCNQGLCTAAGPMVLFDGACLIHYLLLRGVTLEKKGYGHYKQIY